MRQRSTVASASDLLFHSRRKPFHYPPLITPYLSFTAVTYRRKTTPHSLTPPQATVSPTLNSSAPSNPFPLICDLILLKSQPIHEINGFPREFKMELRFWAFWSIEYVNSIGMAVRAGILKRFFSTSVFTSQSPAVPVAASASGSASANQLQFLR
ncbi:hypothetical protein NE237_021876 [Protea cynaroides]|uniref:Uncharacterized protein n=1 Tax=Protea cynaroides TaxID=273540 RepID=A0A9Q0K3P1_9MAGN|nr:hypothetical protein NE237_021876 [Protea cynaroides]